jgi:hypothetical protein
MDNGDVAWILVSAAMVLFMKPGLAFVYGGMDVINADSLHKWLWDLRTLSRAMAGYGFADLKEIDRFRDGRLGAPAWFQCGVDGVKGV